MTAMSALSHGVKKPIDYTPFGDQPNIVLIVMDAFRASHMTALGYERPTTPNLDRLATEGVLFEQAISPSSWSLASHASLFTGLYVSKHGAHDEYKFLDNDPERITLAQRLKAAGYSTWALSQNPWVGPATGLDRGFDTYISPMHFPRMSRANFLHKLYALRSRLTGTRDSGARYANYYAKQFIRQQSQSKSPFLMFIQYLEPHAHHYRVPHGWHHKFLPREIPYKEASQVNQNPDAYITRSVKMTEHDFAITRDLYDSAIAYMDYRIGELIDFLDKKGLTQNTLVIITADHGENLGDHGLLGHRFCLYDTLIHVPLLLRMPGSIAPGQLIGYQVQTHDIVPTILDIVGLEIEPYIQAKSLLRPDSKRAFTIAEKMYPDLTSIKKNYPHFDTTLLNRRLKAFRTNRHKLIWGSDGNNELYDLQADPGETRNLIDELPDTAADLERQLTEWLTSFEPAQARVDEPPQMDEQVVERLRDLGYLE